MSLRKFITIVLGNQAQKERFARVVEDMVILYLLFAAVWSLCHVVSDVFAVWGVL